MGGMAERLPAALVCWLAGWTEVGSVTQSISNNSRHNTGIQ